MSKNNVLKSYKRRIDKYLSERYEIVRVNKRDCFLLPSGKVIYIDIIGGEYNVIVVEHGDSLAEAKRNIMEDVGLYSPEEMDIEAMLEAIMKEIND